MQGPDAWDDSALIEAFDRALESYEEAHVRRPSRARRAICNRPSQGKRKPKQRQAPPAAGAAAPTGKHAAKVAAASATVRCPHPPPRRRRRHS
jgi:hypothetical protein